MLFVKCASESTIDGIASDGGFKVVVLTIDMKAISGRTSCVRLWKGTTPYVRNISHMQSTLEATCQDRSCSQLEQSKLLTWHSLPAHCSIPTMGRPTLGVCSHWAQPLAHCRPQWPCPTLGLVVWTWEHQTASLTQRRAVYTGQPLQTYFAISQGILEKLDASMTDLWSSFQQRDPDWRQAGELWA